MFLFTFPFWVENNTRHIMPVESFCELNLIDAAFAFLSLYPLLALYTTQKCAHAHLRL